LIECNQKYFSCLFCSQIICLDNDHTSTECKFSCDNYPSVNSNITANQAAHLIKTTIGNIEHIKKCESNNSRMKTRIVELENIVRRCSILTHDYNAEQMKLLFDQVTDNHSYYKSAYQLAENPTSTNNKMRINLPKIHIGTTYQNEFMQADNQSGNNIYYGAINITVYGKVYNLVILKIKGK
jgi:hypothetical protein